MYYPKTLIHCLSILSVIFLSACTTHPNKELAPFDTSLVKSMVFQLENKNKIFGIQLPIDKISHKVATNLSEWGYLFKSTPSIDYSHHLKASIGSVSESSTPFGFSFSMGNSDPRSPDFQKANTFSITCSLQPKDQTHSAELVMEVMENIYSHDSNTLQEKEKTINQLTNDISTACYNLLSSLDIKTMQRDNLINKTKPTWIPEIRIETEDIPDNHNKTAIKTEKNKQSLSSEVPVNEPRKRIIINNQGSPVIFKFGHDRK